MTTSFSTLLQKCGAKSGHMTLEVPDDWMQGRSVFGGLQAALALQTMDSLAPGRSLRCLQTNFVGPLSGHVRGEAKLLRSGKNAIQVEAKLYANDTLATQCLAIFGSSLESQVKVTPEQKTLESTSSQNFPYTPGVSPSFKQHFAMRLAEGHMPFAGKETLSTAYELDLLDEGPTSKLHVAALADVVPPLGLSFLSAPTFGSTMSWMLEFVAEPAPDLSLKGWRLDSELVSAEGGYTHQTNVLWSPEGQALALSRQCMLVFG